MENEKEKFAAIHGEEEENDEEEEVKMETFFALVRNFKEMRDRRRKELIGNDDDETEASEKKKKKMKTTHQNRSAWIPTFEREDFDEDFQVGGPSLVLPKPCNLIKKEITTTTKKKIKSEDDRLDLKLAL